MTLDDLLERALAERAELDLPPIPDLGRIRETAARAQPPRRTSMWAAAAACIALLLCGSLWLASTTTTSVSTRPGATITTTTATSTSSTTDPNDQKWAKALGAGEPGGRIPVSGRQNQVGYVNWDVVVGRPAGMPDVSPVYAEGGRSSDRGEIVGYWAPKIGWIDKAAYEAPGFDLDEYAKTGGLPAGWPTRDLSDVAVPAGMAPVPGPDGTVIAFVDAEEAAGGWVTFPLLELGGAKTAVRGIPAVDDNHEIVGYVVAGVGFVPLVEAEDVAALEKRFKESESWRSYLREHPEAVVPPAS